MAEDREAARAALERAAALIRLADSLLEANDEQDKALAVSVQSCAIRLPSRSSDGAISSLSGMTALVLARSGRPSELAQRVAAQAHSRKAVQGQVPRARQLQSQLQELADAARPAARGPLRGLFSSKATRQQAGIECIRLVELLRGLEEGRAEEGLRSALTAVAAAPSGTPDAAASSLAAAGVLSLRAPGKAPVSLRTEQLDVIRRFLELAPVVLRSRPALVLEVERSFRIVQDRKVAAQLREIPPSALKQATAGRVRFKTLSEAGCESVQDVLTKGGSALAAISGISETTARQLVAAAGQLQEAVRADLRFRVDLDRSDDAVTRLLTSLYQLREHDRRLEGRGGEIQDSLDLLAPLIAIPSEVTRMSLLAQTDPSSALADVGAAVSLLDGGKLLQVLMRGRPVGAMSDPPGPRVWEDFERDSAGYYTTLSSVVDLRLDEDATAGHLPKEIVEAVHGQALDESLLQGRVSLRGYQSFGARYALVQRRTLLGDEMGLGKTVQAIAVMAHLTSGGARHHLVVCPASVLVNWTKEIRRHSRLDAFLVHGSDRAHTWQTWLKRGGVAVTTFGTLPVLPQLPRAMPLVVVDEAHYLKNPDTKRAQALLPVVRAADRALFLTGTPLENRLEEFRQLVTYLQPDVGRRLSDIDGVASRRRYREELAPVYLRRNQEDVLQELPELVVTEEWGSLTPHQMPGYRRAVASRNFMLMRRVGITCEPTHSEKLGRLKEIADEAAANGHKVIVFSYFRDVLTEVAKVLGDRVVGQLTGSVPATQRQGLVDRFSRAGTNAVLLAQITAGGTGMNMQAGSVVVICEPQVKPSLETQAIARAHRMGQLHGVQVHRLLMTDSVDQRMVEILATKQRLFDEYARGSEVAASSPEAVDVSEKKLAADVIEQEMERLAITRAEQLEAQQAADVTS